MAAMVSAPDGSTTSRAALGGQPDGPGDLALADRDDAVEQGAQVLERARAQRLRPRPVGDRPRDVVGRPAHDLAGGQRVAAVGGQLGLDADDPAAGLERLDRDGHAAGQPAATDRHQDARDIGQVLDDLQPDRALAGDDPVVVERRDDGQTALGGELLGDGLALVRGGARR